MWCVSPFSTTGPSSSGRSGTLLMGDERPWQQVAVAGSIHGESAGRGIAGVMVVNKPPVHDQSELDQGSLGLRGNPLPLLTAPRIDVSEMEISSTVCQLDAAVSIHTALDHMADSGLMFAASRDVLAKPATDVFGPPDVEWLVLAFAEAARKEIDSGQIA